MESPPPWDNLVSAHEQTLLDHMASQHVDAMAHHSRTRRKPGVSRTAATANVVAMARPSSDDAEDLQAAQEVTFAEVLADVQTRPAQPQYAEIPQPALLLAVHDIPTLALRPDARELAELLAPPPSMLRRTMDALARLSERFIELLKKPQ